MGLAASQARLLLLTARKSDLEYRAQMISNRKLLLSMQTEEIATAYTEAIGNRKLYYTFQNDLNNGTQQTELLTYDNITDASNGTQFRIVDQSGRVVVKKDSKVEVPVLNLSGNETKTTYTCLAGQASAVDKSKYQLPTFVESEEKDENGNPKKQYYYYTNEAAKETVEGKGYTLKQAMDEGLIGLTPAGTKVTELQAEDANKDIIAVDNLFNFTAYANEVKNATVAPQSSALLNNADAFQNLLQNGTFILEQLVNGEWTSTPLSGVKTINSKLYTDDDYLAQAEYEQQTAIIQSADKMLDLELKQVETQQKACENEIESVKKILEKNTEAFKAFS